MEATAVADQIQIQDVLKELGIQEVNMGACTGTKWLSTNGDLIESYSPADGTLIAKIQQGTWDDYEKVINTATEAFKTWRTIPAPKRGEVVRQIVNALRENKEHIGEMVYLERGKINK